MFNKKPEVQGLPRGIGAYAIDNEINAQAYLDAVASSMDALQIALDEDRELTPFSALLNYRMQLSTLNLLAAAGAKNEVATANITPRARNS